jgi:cell fate (sporulation/competence/biofilm development) regulator YmcA (YheA/YmcA/DUF963 family)
MMSVVSFKVKKELKKKMDKFRNKINWAEELRRFVEERTRILEAEENIAKVMDELQKLPVETPRGFSATLVREDRDSG